MTAGAVKGEDGAGAGWKPGTKGGSVDGHAFSLGQAGTGQGAGRKPGTNGIFTISFLITWDSA